MLKHSAGVSCGTGRLMCFVDIFRLIGSERTVGSAVRESDVFDEGEGREGEEDVAQNQEASLT